jgi:hypothetical protein
VVSASIFYDQHFAFKVLSLEKGKDLLERTGQTVLFVMGGDDDGEKREGQGG